MKTIAAAVLALGLGVSVGAQASSARDCLFEGVVSKNAEGKTSVIFRSARDYNTGGKCKLRRSERRDIRLPVGPQLQAAPEGTPVKYRFRSDADAGARIELVSLGNEGVQIAQSN